MDILSVFDIASQLQGVNKKGFEALKMKYEGYSTNEISQAYGAQPRQVRKWMVQAIQRIRAVS